MNYLNLCFFFFRKTIGNRLRTIVGEFKFLSSINVSARIIAIIIYNVASDDVQSDEFIQKFVLIDSESILFRILHVLKRPAIRTWCRQLQGKLFLIRNEI